MRYRTRQKEHALNFLQTKYSQQELVLKQQEREKIWYATLLAVTLIFLIGIIYFFLQRRKINKQKLIIEKLRVRAEEKQAISVHLHDAIASDILLGLQHSESMKDSIKTKEFDKLISILERAYEKARKISQDLSQIYFHQTSFQQKVINLCVEYSFHNDLKVEHKGLDSIEWEKINKEVKIAIFEILREGFSNILKHAQASRVNVSFLKKGNYIYFKIQDNGIGIQNNNVVEGIGMLNMKKRVGDLAGTINTISNIENGTILEINIPILYE